jgi:tetratricopeptide (TPR) repeat protein
LSGKLLEHGQLVLEKNNVDLAKDCLQLSLALHKTPEADAILSNILVTEEEGKKVAIQKAKQARKKASIRKAKVRKKEQQDQKKKTEVLLAETQQALAEDDLQVARATFIQIPSSAITDSKVLAIQGNLDEAVDIRVKKLMTAGDAQYRRDNVLLAVRTWTKALSLDPDNTELRERVERANKVLARLEELKRQQRRQPPTLTLPIQPTRVGVTRTPSR